MGDHRFSFKAEFEMHGVKDVLNLAWCNWSGGWDGIDRRITEWIENVRDRAMAKFDNEMAAHEAAHNKEKIERAEREQLAWLKEKYEPRR